MIKKYVLQYKVYLITLIILNICIWCTSMIIPYVTGKYVDELINKKNLNTIYYFTKIAFVIFAANVALSYINSILMVKFETKSAFSLNYDTIEYVKRIPIMKLKDMDSAYLNQRINTDSNVLTSFIINAITNILIKSLTLIFVLYILFRISVKISIMLIILIPIYLILYFLFRKPLYKLGYDYKEKQSKFFAKMNEQLFNLRLIKINSSFELLANQLRCSFTDLLKSVLKYAKVSYMFFSMDGVISSVSKLLLLFVGGIEIIKNNITIGDFTIISNYFNMLLGCVSYFLQLGKSYQEASVSYKRLNEIFIMDIEANGLVELEHIESIKLQDVNFSYDDKNYIIQDFNYTFEKGNVYCIIGENGIGKSTFINLILGLFNESYGGNIYYNSINISDINLYYLRKNLIGMSEQEPTLLNDSILNNLKYFVDIKKSTDIDLWCEKFDLHKLFSKLPDGLESNIYENANNISGGEKQKISLVRTFIKNSEVIILDEPTSALDKGSIENLKNIITHIKKDKIIIIVTHNMSILEIADDVINFNANKNQVAAELEEII